MTQYLHTCHVYQCGGGAGLRCVCGAIVCESHHRPGGPGKSDRCALCAGEAARRMFALPIALVGGATYQERFERWVRNSYRIGGLR